MLFSTYDNLFERNFTIPTIIFKHDSKQLEKAGALRWPFQVTVKLI